MAKLHEILSVEADREGMANKIVKEAVGTMKEHSKFIERSKVWKMFDEKDEKDTPPAEHQEMTTTVAQKLRYVARQVSRWWDTVYQKEMTNQEARADLVVDGVTLVEAVPATCLLGLETKLKKLRSLYETIPTLPSGIAWERDDDKGHGVYVTVNPVTRFKTAKTFQHKVLYDATKEHPAQIERWEETKNTGQSSETMWSGMLTSAEKSEMLERLDNLTQSCKKARQRANNIVVKKGNLGETLFNYLHGEL